MKKGFWVLGITAVVLLMAACSSQDADAGLLFCGARWGETWEEIQKNTKLQGEPLNGDPSRVRIENAEYMGFPVEAALLFDTKEGSETFGLNTVWLHYQEEDEQALLAAIEAVYGERKETYTDKNGFENPLGQGGWVSEETLEDVLTEDEIRQARERFRQGHAQMGDAAAESLVDARMRAPLTRLLMDGEENSLQFDGVTAVYAAYLQQAK